MKRFFRVLLISVLIVIALIVISFALHLADHIRNVKATEARFTHYLNNPKAFDKLPKREDKKKWFRTLWSGKVHYRRQAIS